MTDDLQLLRDTAARIFEDYVLPDSLDVRWNAALWSVLEGNGLTKLSSLDNKSNTGGNVRESVALLSVAGRFAANVPLNETLLGTSVLSECSLHSPNGPLTMCFASEGNFQRVDSDWRLSGSFERVPWATEATNVVVLGSHQERELAAIVPLARCRVVKGLNLAGEPRDDVEMDVTLESDQVASLPRETIRSVQLKGALFRAAMMAGASERAFELTLQYAKERKQFGRSIGGFQVVQHEVAKMAGEVIALRTACEVAVLQFATAPSLTRATILAVASAKAQAERTASVVTRGAHQVHGAMGVTREHILRVSTTRLWAWREEWGSASQWWSEIGSLVVDGELSAWETLTVI